MKADNELSIKKNMPILERRLFGLLPRGSSHPIPVTEISNILNIDSRYTHQLILDLVLKYNIPICSNRQSDNNGVFIPVTEEERAHGLVSLKEQHKTLGKRIEVVEKVDLSIVKEYEQAHPETLQYRFIVPYTQIEFDFESMN